MQIFLIRHGKPNIHRGLWIGRKGFAAYIETYEEAGLDPVSKPPGELIESIKGATRVYCSNRPRSIESARAVAPLADLVSDAVFMEAQLKSPVVPFLRMSAALWSIVGRLAWHAGHSHGVETWYECKARALKAMEILAAAAGADGKAVLVAHGYINLMIGIRLFQRGWVRKGKHRADYWNCVVYEKQAELADQTEATRAKR